MKNIILVSAITLISSVSAFACIPESKTFACVVERHLVEFNNAIASTVNVRTHESRPFAITSGVVFETHTGERCTASVNMRRRSERVKLSNLSCQ